MFMDLSFPWLLCAAGAGAGGRFFKVNTYSFGCLARFGGFVVFHNPWVSEPCTTAPKLQKHSWLD